MIIQQSPAKQPDLVGVFGRAWRCTHPDIAEDFPATVCSWLVSFPGAHPLWGFWSLGVITLDERAGVEPTVKHFEHATHEFLLIAVNPETQIPDVDRWERAALMSPPDLAHQVALPGDEQAREIAETMIRTMLELGASPDVDNRGFWQIALDKTAEHYRMGVH